VKAVGWSPVTEEGGARRICRKCRRRRRRGTAKMETIKSTPARLEVPGEQGVRGAPPGGVRLTRGRPERWGAGEELTVVRTCSQRRGKQGREEGGGARWEGRGR
jgi:hypothetical protein